MRYYWNPERTDVLGWAAAVGAIVLLVLTVLGLSGAYL